MNRETLLLTHYSLRSLLRTAPLVDPERRQRRRPLLVVPVLRPVVDGQLLALGERLCVDHMPVHSVHSSLVRTFRERRLSRSG